MYHPTTRVLAVLELLQSHGRMTGMALAQRLEVNIRTLRRYIIMLQDLGIPILAERGRNGAYELGAGFKLPPMMFTNDEALALAVGLLAARHMGLAETAHAIESARSKLEQVMPHELKSRVRALTDTISLDLTAVPIISPSEVMMTMSSAAQSRRRVHMHYKSSQNALTERDFDPYGLAYRQGRWYVVGRCGLREDLRSFRLDRVMKAELTEMRFERPTEFNALTTVLQSIADMPRQFRFEVLLKTDLVTAHAEISNVLGLLEPFEGGVMLRGSTNSIDWLARQLSSFECDFVVYNPPELHDALRRRAEHIVKLADLKKGELIMEEPMTKEKLLEELRSSRQEWKALLAEVGEDRMTQPGAAGDWSVKDVAAHLNTFVRWYATAAEAALRGELPEPDGT
jgi:predicted DNA-binding transcriptional regulator YafY